MSDRAVQAFESLNELRAQDRESARTGHSSVVLQSVKYTQNLAAAIRACACFGAERVYWTGNRIQFEDRLPREMRMKQYSNVEVLKTERPFDLTQGLTPVCVELLPGSQSLIDFTHPTNALYVFGPEDGSVSQIFRRFCHHFVYVPSVYCLNLAATVNIVLFDRIAKQRQEESCPKHTNSRS